MYGVCYTEYVLKLKVISALRKLNKCSLMKENAGSSGKTGFDPGPVRVAQGVEAWPDSTRLVQRIAGSNPASGMDVCVCLCVCNLKQ